MLWIAVKLAKYGFMHLSSSSLIVPAVCLGVRSSILVSKLPTLSHEYSVVSRFDLMSLPSKQINEKINITTA